MNISDIVSSYNLKNPRLAYVGSLGSHSALDVSCGAADEGLKSVVTCKKGRERTYIHHLKRERGSRTVGCIDKVILLNDLKQLADEDVQNSLRRLKTIYVPDRSFEVYLGYDVIGSKFNVPLLGNRDVLPIEERTGQYKLEKNQDYFVKLAGLLRVDRLLP